MSAASDDTPITTRRYYGRPYDSNVSLSLCFDVVVSFLFFFQRVISEVLDRDYMYLQKCCKMFWCFILHVTTSNMFYKCFMLKKTFAKMLQNILTGSNTA